MLKRMARQKFVTAALLVLASFWLAGQLCRDKVLAQTNVGGELPGLTSAQQTAFSAGQGLFLRLWTPKEGVGPIFTSVSCVHCHSVPATGGSAGKGIQSTLFGKTNPDGSFNPLTNEGGILLQRGTSSSFPSQFSTCHNPGISPEVIPADATVISTRIPPALFGAGLLDSVPDSAILANAVPQGNGIQGSANVVPDQNGRLRVGRFGRKAQFATLLQITGEAFQHDLGVTNPVSPNEDLPQGNPIPANCQQALTQPNDPVGGETISIFNFLLFLAPNTPAPLSASALAGLQTFESIGCVKCHIQSYTTDSNIQVPTNFSGGLSGPIAALSNQAIFPYSDLLLHDMGPGLADGMPMGQATGSQWRTTPLWGVSKRTTYLHDGRATNLTSAILAHGGEASAVIVNFQTLSTNDQANLLAFLSSL